MPRMEHVTRLGDLTTLISSGSTPKGGSEIYLSEGPVMLIRSQNVRMNALVLNDVAYVTHAIDAGMKRSRVRYGDVLLNITGASIGRVAAFELEDVSANVNQHVCIIRPKSGELFTRYLTHLISSPAFQVEIDRLQRGGTRQALTFSQISEFKIPLPPLPEQRRIAAILDKADALRAKRREAIAKLDRLLQSVFLEMFGDPVINPRGWPKESLLKLTSKIGSGATPKGGDSSYHSSGISFIRSMNVHDGEFLKKNLAFIDDVQAAKLRNVCVERGDVLLNITGASVARVCRVPERVLPARVNQHVAIIRCLPNISSVYLEYVLMSQPMKAALLGVAGAGATREAITKRQLEELLVPVPDESLQMRFEVVAQRVSKELAQLQSALKQHEAMFASLQVAAFSGSL